MRRPCAALAGLLLLVGLLVTFVHDYAYRRADSASTGDYELGGLVSHAGTDLLVLTVVLTLVAFLWIRQTRCRS